MRIVLCMGAVNHKVRGMVGRKPQTLGELLCRSPYVSTTRINCSSYILTGLYCCWKFACTNCSWSPRRLMFRAPNALLHSVTVDLDMHYFSPARAAWTHTAIAFPGVPLNEKVITFQRFSPRFWPRSRSKPHQFVKNPHGAVRSGIVCLQP